MLTTSTTVDFSGLRIKATRTAIPWPPSTIRRASINSFGYGGSNVHIVLEQAIFPNNRPRHTSSYAPDDGAFTLDHEQSPRPSVLVLSANNESSLRANIAALSNHLVNPRVSVRLADLAYTLSERRTRLFHRAFVTARSTDLDETGFTVGKKGLEVPRVGFVFTGQGAQWPRMGGDILEFFPWTRSVLEELDGYLQGLPEPPSWSLIG